MTLRESITDYAAKSERKLRETDKAAFAAGLQAKDDELTECMLMSRTASKIIAAGQTKTLDELIARTTDELILQSAVFDYIQRKAGLTLPEDEVSIPLVLPIAEQLKADKLDEQLLGRLALAVIAARSAASAQDPLLTSAQSAA